MRTIYNYLFPVRIYELDKTLIIGDRRATQDLLVLGLSGFGLIAVSNYFGGSFYTR